MSVKDEKKGYTVVGTVDVCRQRELPNSDPADDDGREYEHEQDDHDNFTYQEQPWDRHSENHPRREKK